jgi:hypothetical protein
MPKLDFLPARDGWHFENRFKSTILPGVLNVQIDGLCGGMCMTALDYWRSGVAVPTHREQDLGADGLPDDGTTLRDYIWDRQVHSVTTKASFTRFIVPLPTDENFFWWATNSEFDVVARHIDQGRPCLLGLIDINRNPLRGHQVICYGYERSPQSLWLYDPNRPDYEARLQPESVETGVAVWAPGRPNDVKTNYRGYFWMDVYNWDETPPYQPPYFDLAVKNGITFTPSDNLVIERPLACDLTVHNYGEYPSPLSELFVYVRGPSGENLDHLLGGGDANSNPVQPGEDRQIHRVSEAFGSVPGRYIVGTSYLSHLNHWRPLKVGEPGAMPVRQLDVRTAEQQLIADQWFDVHERDQDVFTGMEFRPGDEFAFSAMGHIWAGVWFTRENGPEGWTDRLETNPRSPLHSGPQAHPFSLLGCFTGEPYFYIGTGLSRRRYESPVPRQLLLRINDDTPANGSGTFRCRVQQWRPV